MQTRKFKSIIAGMALIFSIILAGLTLAPAKPQKIIPNAEKITAPAFGICVPAHCYDVHDGDTVYVECKFRVHVRLYDCWCPELSEKLGPEARDEMIKIAKDKDVKFWIPADQIFAAMKDESKDIGDMTTMGRVLGHVQVDGADETLSEHMVAHKLAATKKGAPLGQ